MGKIPRRKKAGKQHQKSAMMFLPHVPPSTHTLKLGKRRRIDLRLSLKSIPTDHCKAGAGEPTFLQQSIVLLCQAGKSGIVNSFGEEIFLRRFDVRTSLNLTFLACTLAPHADHIKTNYTMRG